jgi:hypothetical protein
VNGAWYVVDTVTGCRFEPGHRDYPTALLALADTTASNEGCTAGRFDVERQTETPWVYAVPAQTNREGRE